MGIAWWEILMKKVIMLFLYYRPNLSVPSCYFSFILPLLSISYCVVDLAHYQLIIGTIIINIFLVII